MPVLLRIPSFFLNYWLLKYCLHSGVLEVHLQLIHLAIWCSPYEGDCDRVVTMSHQERHTQMGRDHLVEAVATTVLDLNLKVINGILM